MKLSSLFILGIATIKLYFLWMPCTPFIIPGRIARYGVTSNVHRSLAHSSTSLQSQILDFIEPTTGVSVKLIGTMHYNPASIKLAEDTINKLEAEGKLGSIIIESCDIRWNATLENDLVKSALQSEMRAAHDLGLFYNRPVVLGDQRINVTVNKLTEGAKEAVVDLFNPIGGWGRLYRSIAAARTVAVPFGENYLGLDSFFDPKLLGASPVSLIKYPLSYIVRSPIFGVALIAFVFLTELSDVSEGSSFLTTPESASDLLVSVFFSFLETIIFARIFLKELLAERNEVLAINILEQCKNYQSGDKNTLFSLLQSNRDKSNGAIYAKDSVVGKPEKNKTVVAVLGLAHCNGIKKIMTD